MGAQEPPTPRAPASIPELERRLVGILNENHVPGLGIAIVSRDTNLWTAGLGKADVASGTDATADTLFRIGSTSKGFVALSILKLREEGRLQLEDRVRDLIPEIAFTNPWEATDPVRVVHLLEHTTGWDDIHLTEYTHNDPSPTSLRAALDFHPDSRVCRWRPGTRFAYCNSGPAVAAYIVEKTSGENFEEYVQRHFFDPLGMASATYYQTPDVERLGATLYKNDGRTPNPYWHIMMRPAGAINASASDMANYVRMYLGHGELDGVRVIGRESIERMERPTSTLGARAGLPAGYGLCNYTSGDGAFVFHGHNGGVNGGLTEMAYLPDDGLGYAFMINSANPKAFARISHVLQAYVTRGLTAPALPPAAIIPPELAREYSGLYTQANPRGELSRFLSRFLAVSLKINGSNLSLRSALPSRTRDYVAVSERLARRITRPIASLALLKDGSRRYVEADGDFLERTSAALVWAQASLAVLCLAWIGSAFLFSLVWMPRRLFGGLKGKPDLGVRAWPWLAGLLLVLFVAVAAVGMGDAITRLGRISFWSVSQFALGVAFAAVAGWSLLHVILARRRPMNRVAYWHSLFVALAACTVAGYLAYWGVLGLRTWAY